jgi:hypothetical protein
MTNIVILYSQAHPGTDLTTFKKLSNLGAGGRVQAQVNNSHRNHF